jgi:hypothetical protein
LPYYLYYSASKKCYTFNLFELGGFINHKIENLLNNDEKVWGQTTPLLCFSQFGKDVIMVALKYTLGLTFFNNNFLGM